MLYTQTQVEERQHRLASSPNTSEKPVRKTPFFIALTWVVMGLFLLSSVLGSLSLLSLTLKSTTPGSGLMMPFQE